MQKMANPSRISITRRKPPLASSADLACNGPENTPAQSLAMGGDGKTREGSAMSTNRSSAVMQKRHESQKSLDDFPTPPWATRALCDFLSKGPPSMPLATFTVREPAANRGYMVRPLSEYFGSVDASDIADYGMGYRQEDFLFPFDLHPVDWTITNPPFTLAEQFIERALATSRIGCAVILRSAFLESVGRYNAIFSHNPPAYVLQFAERVPMVKEMVDPTASSATAYSWLIWIKGSTDTQLRWIAPCRKKLERADDYAIMRGNKTND